MQATSPRFTFFISQRPSINHRPCETAEMVNCLRPINDERGTFLYLVTLKNARHETIHQKHGKHKVHTICARSTDEDGHSLRDCRTWRGTIARDIDTRTVCNGAAEAA